MKKNIAIIMGGYSSEVAISLKSGNVVYRNLDPKKYQAYRIHILAEKWVALDHENNEYAIDKNDFSFNLKGKTIVFDCVFNAIHGTPGEDGKILAYLELLGIKHTSAPFYQMALTFNKRDCLSVAKQYGIKTATSYFLNKGDVIDIAAIIKKVNLPCFVKPNKAGSSFGISKVKTTSQLVPAIEKAFKEDSELLIESFLNGREVTIGVVPFQGNLKVLPITEIQTDNDFFDYQAKYEGCSKEITPANIPLELQTKLEKIALKTYKALNMRGFSRSEYIIVNNEPYFLEINTVPGLTTASILPQQAKKGGILLANLVENAIENALKTI